MLTPTHYRGEQDLSALQDLLRAGLLTNPNLTYVHPGDIEWWFYYNPAFLPPEETVTLWRSEAGDLAAWLLLDTRARVFNLFVHPAHRTDDLFDHLLAWIDAECLKHLSDEAKITCEECLREDELYKAALERAGYSSEPFMVLFEQTLTEPLPVPSLPEGFRFLEHIEERYIDSRANAHYSAFTRTKPSKMTPDLYRRFMTAPGYDPTLDISIVNAQDEVVAFAMAWADDMTKRSEYEPVGTHKDYQRRGLGRAALLEGLRRLQTRGIKTANVVTPVGDAGNVAFYPSAGFEIVGYSDHYHKVIGASKDI
jgi:mycothiol synthase